MVTVAAEHLITRGSGTLVGITSIAAIRGNGGAPAYGASKAFESHYLAALRHKFAKLGSQVIVLDVKPGFVDTAMAKGDGCFGSHRRESFSQILKAIDLRRTHVYITRRWRHWLGCCGCSLTQSITDFDRCDFDDTQCNGPLENFGSLHESN